MVHLKIELIFWETLLNRPCIRSNNVIIDNDLNFSLGPSKSWGPWAKLDPLIQVGSLTIGWWMWSLVYGIYDCGHKYLPYT